MPTAFVDFLGRECLVSFSGKDRPSPAEIRSRANRVLDRWQSYPDFGHFFADLLAANDITDLLFARQYTQATRRSISETKVHHLRHGQFQPPYELIANIADHALLSLDPEHLRPAQGSTPAGDHRLALYAAAGLIEVTPNSVNQWNREILTRWQRQRVHALSRPPLIWKKLMHKLLSFQCQGGRWSHRDIAQAANTRADAKGQLDAERIHVLLSGIHALPTESERLALAHAAGLSAAQTKLIERAIASGTLPLSSTRFPSPFSTQLNKLLGRLRKAGINQQQLVLRSGEPGQIHLDLSKACLSYWKNGQTQPTLAGLRALVRVLNRCHKPLETPLVLPEEVRQLVEAAGFRVEQIEATTHDIVAAIDATTRLKPLLVALRLASDLNVPMTAVDSPPRLRGPDEPLMARLLRDWERETSPLRPNPAQVRDLMSRYNRLLEDQGRPSLSYAEVAKVVLVAQRNRQDGRTRGSRGRAHESHPPSARERISPRVDTECTV